MKGAMLYVDAGKGHYVPAKALADSFTKLGYEATVENLFSVLDSPFWDFFCKYDWRFLLHHPRLESIVHSLLDNSFNSYLIMNQGLKKKHLAAFEAWYESYHPDFILSTNFIGGIILPAVVKKLKIDIPIYQYCADVFDTPKTGINNDLTKMYFPTDLGIQNAIKKGQDPSTLAICPFPIRKQFESFSYTTKSDIRKKLNLEDKFTILCSLGGEGIGNIRLLYELAKEKIDCQFVVIGGNSKTTQSHLRRFSKYNPDFPIHTRGFVDNVQEYIAASDIQIGKAGANAVMEAIFMKHPFIVTEVLYAFRASKDFINKYEIGWDENNPIKQAQIIKEYINNKELRDSISTAFKNLPITFDADLFRDQLIDDTTQYYSNK